MKSSNIETCAPTEMYLVVMKARISCRHWVIVSTLPPLLHTPSPILSPSAPVLVRSDRCCSDGEALMPKPLSSDLRVE